MRMAFQGLALLLAVVAGVGFAVYHIYSQNTAQTHGNQSKSYTYVYEPAITASSITEGSSDRRKRRRSSTVEKCIICHETLLVQVQKLKCLHSFHKECIIEWFKHSKTCPVCRSPA